MIVAMTQYGGFERWQLWFDNPNKAAVLLAELAVIGMALLSDHRHSVRLLGVGTFLTSVYSLLRTFSRGGFVSLVAGFAIMIFGAFRNRERRRLRLLCYAGVCACAVAASVHIGFFDRMAHGFSGNDKSVGNRIGLWCKVPKMIHDAPLGWGLGRSGEAYMQWYQPLEKHERYRTLVSSHLTVVVETGVVCGFGWILLWSIFLACGCGFGRRLRCWLCLAEWLVLFVAGWFSSVCENWELWVVPGLIHIFTIARFLRNQKALPNWRSSIRILFPVVVAYVTFLTIIMVVHSPSDIGRSSGRIMIGKGEPMIWIVPDAAVLGGELYPREIRDFFQNGGTGTFAVVEEPSQVPPDVDYVVICGAADASGVRGRKKTVWLSPIRQRQIPDEDDIVIRGEFADVSSPCRATHVITVNGAGDYLPNWPERIVANCLQ